MSDNIELFTIVQEFVTDIVVSSQDDFIELAQDYDVVGVKLDNVSKLVESLESLDFGTIIDETNDDGTENDFGSFLTVTQSNFRYEYVNIGDYDGKSVTLEKGFIAKLVGGLRDQGIA